MIAHRHHHVAVVFLYESVPALISMRSLLWFLTTEKWFIYLLLFTREWEVWYCISLCIWLAVV